MSRKLLLADDSVTIRKVIEITFANQNFDLVLVGNGDEALEKANLDPPDIILADIIMPGKSGYELCQAIKQNPRLAQIPILLLAGSFEPFDEARAQAAGANGWITKPFETQAIIAKVEELLETAAQTRQTEEFAASPLASQENTEFSFAPAEEEPIHAAVEFESLSETSAEEPPAPEEVISEEEILEAEAPVAPREEDIQEPTPAAPLFMLEQDAPLAPEKEAEPEFELPTEPVSSFEPAPEDVPLGREPEPEEESFLTAELGTEQVLEEQPKDFSPQASDLQEEEGIFFLSEDDIVIEEEEEEESASAPEETFFATEEEKKEIPAGDFAFAPLAPEESEAFEEPEKPQSFVAEETFAEPAPEQVFEMNELPAEEEDDEGVEFTFDSLEEEDEHAGLEQEALSIEPAAEMSEYDLVEEQESGEELPPSALEFAGEENGLEGSGKEAVAEPDSEVVARKIAALSDTDVQALVEKAVKARIDKMAQEILERIAWEVVPNLSESLIKEEIRKIKELQR